MYNLSLAQDPAISRDQLREQIRTQVQQATAEARASAQDAAKAAREAQVTVDGPRGTPTISINPGSFERDMPPRVKDVSIAFFITMAAVIIGFPLMRAIAKRIERGTPQPARIPPEMQAQIQQLVQSVDAIAIEVERISEGQRFTSKMLAEKAKEGV
ncbi:MAG TPA: hypothetical protein VNC11_12150 [Gemmatimonadaceae bacterium]|jgi:hypothetical protein|nr:hypothetical protein [Gemmatimonadaceae bacterium]